MLQVLAWSASYRMKPNYPFMKAAFEAAHAGGIILLCSTFLSKNVNQFATEKKISASNFFFGVVAREWGVLN